MARAPLRYLLATASLTMLLAGPAAYGGATSPLVLEHVTLEDGLTQSTVMDILQDSQGFIWFATESGLNRYDGYAIQSYHRDRQDPAALRSDYIWKILEDADSNLWLATEGGGVARWNRRADTFTNFVHDPADPGTLSSDDVRALAAAPDGRIWVGTRDGGLNLLDPATGSVQRFRHDPGDPSSLAGDSIFALHPGHAGQLWIGTDNGLSRLDLASGEFTHYRHDPGDPHSLSDNHIISVYEDSVGSVWIGTFTGGLNRLDRKHNRFERFTHDAEDGRSLSHDYVRAIFEDDRGRLWIGTENGLNLMDRRSGDFTRYHRDRSDPQSLNDSYIMSIYQDQSGLLWFGTRFGGVSRWNPGSWAMGHYREDWIADAFVTSFADDSMGTAWIGTMGAGLSRLDLATREVSPFPGSANLADQRVMALLRDQNGDLWIGTMTGGLSVYSAETGSMVTFRAGDVEETSLGADGIMALFEDRGGNIWIGTFGGGVSMYDRLSGTFEHYRHDPDDPGTLSGRRATDIVEDLNGMIWVATDSGGINMIDRASGTVRAFRHDPDDPGSLSSDSVYALHVDTDGTLWVGTAGSGLDRLVGSSREPDTIRFQNRSRHDGLSSDVIYGIVSDAHGTLWLSSNYGLMRMDRASGEVKELHRSHGLQGEEFTFGAHHRGMDGRLYFGGPDGINVFFPPAALSSRPPPPIVLTSIETMNRPADTGAPYPVVDRLDLDHRDDVLSFEFAALDFAAPAENTYAYRLDGFDQDWIYAGDTRRATYTNLDAGDYVFRVKAANSDGRWNDLGLSIPVSVAPAPWETIWARGLYGVLAVLLLLGAFGWHRRRLALKNEYAARLEEEVSLRTTQLEERNQELREVSRAKSDFLARMSHEIRTPMNGVLGMTELLQCTTLNPRQHRFASTIQQSARSLLQIINDILDFSKIEAGKLNLEAIEFDFNEMVEDTVDLLATQAHNKGVALVGSTPPELEGRVVGDPLRLRQVLTNLVGNAVKFTDRGEVLVNVSLAEADEEQVSIQVEVTDTGPGIREEVLNNIFDAFSQADETMTRRSDGTGLGLSICKQLLELMDGEIGVESEPGVGSRFWFRIPLQRAALPGGTAAKPQPLEGRKVLALVEPGSIRDALQRMFTAWKLEPTFVDDVEGLLERLRGGVTDWDTVLLDAGDGLFDLLEQLSGLRATPGAKAPRVVVLARDDDPLAGQLSHCIDACVVKPVRQSRLRSALAGPGAGGEVPEDRAARMCSQAQVAESLIADSLAGRVMLVEDNAVNQLVAQGMLASIGCEVSTAANGQIAIDRLAVEDFDLVLMDCQMPVLDGFGATRTIRNRGQRVPIIALTANAVAGDRERCLAVGMDDYLCKPFTLDALRTVLQRWLPAPAEAGDLDDRDSAIRHSA
ncbi:MAG: two-component regulator propeller domain-containing protein [Gammaproteobacteria bacterium]